MNSNGNTALCNLFIMKKSTCSGRRSAAERKNKETKIKNKKETPALCIRIESWNTVIEAQKLFVTLLTESSGARRKKKGRKYQ